MSMCDKEEYNISDYYFKIEEGKKLSKVQEGIVLLIHLVFIILIPMILIYLINNDWLGLIMLLIWWHTLDYTSPWVQKNITNKIIRWLGIIN